MYCKDLKKKWPANILMFFLLISLKSTFCLAATLYYVSPDGNDRNTGTIEKPFKTVKKARNTVRERISEGLNGNVIVYLRGGRYVLDETVTFGLEDSGKDDFKIFYQNYPDEEPIFTSDINITGWKKVQKDLKGLPEKAQGKIYVARLPETLSRFYSLYDGSQKLSRARGEGFESPIEHDSFNGPDQSTLQFPAGALKSWPNIDNVEIVIRPTAGWVVNILPLKAVDEQNNIATTAVPGTYILGKLRWIGGKNVWVENVFDVLDEPGEWVLDSHSKRLYLWPKNGKPGNAIYAPALTEYIRIEGNIDYNGPQDKPVKNIIFKGITFTRADYYRRGNEHIGKGLQHDWELFDSPSAMVRLRGAENCAIKSCRFINSSATAIRLDLHCRKNIIRDNVITDIGGVGVLLAGYGPGTKDVNKKNVVVNNHIQRVGQVYWHSPGIFAWQSGENLIANNTIHHVPYSAIVVSGRIHWDRTGQGGSSKTIRWKEVEKALCGNTERPDWYQREQLLHGRKNIIEKNDIHNVTEVLFDGNGIYISGTGGGNIVRQNYIHDCLSPHATEAIRCDDDQHKTRIEANLIVRMGGMASGITIKGVNDIVNNIIAFPQTTPKRGMITLEIGPVEGSVIKNNILITDNPNTPLYYQQRLYGEGPIPKLRDCDADNNIYYCTKDPDWGKSHLQEERKYGIEKNSIVADPLFVDAENDDFTLKPESPALKLGFKPIDVSQIGYRPAY